MYFQAVVLSDLSEGSALGSALVGEEVCVTNFSALPTLQDPKDSYSRITGALRNGLKII